MSRDQFLDLVARKSVVDVISLKEARKQAAVTLMASVDEELKKKSFVKEGKTYDHKELSKKSNKELKEMAAAWEWNSK